MVFNLPFLEKNDFHKFYLQKDISIQSCTREYFHKFDHNMSFTSLIITWFL